MARFYNLIDHYIILVYVLAIIGVMGFFKNSEIYKKQTQYILLLLLLVLIWFYESLSYLLVYNRIVNFWVYNIFYFHFSSIMLLLLIRSFLKSWKFKTFIACEISIFLCISIFLHSIGFLKLNDSPEVMIFLVAFVVILACGLFFYELVSLPYYLERNILRLFEFWIVTINFFYYSCSFMVFVSYKYLYTNHLNIFFSIVEIPRNMALLCCLIYCLVIWSETLEKSFKIKLFDVRGN